MEENSVISSLYPPPPPYLKVFTNENVSKLEALVKEYNNDMDLVAEAVQGTPLQFMIPPPKPEGESYRSFGDIWNFKDKFMTLQDAGIPQLYSNTEEDNNADEEIFTLERIEELKKLTKSLLLNFLELLGILAKNPAAAKEKVGQIRILLINLHHLLNSYRLHQSREILILKIEEKISQDNEEIEKIEEVCKSVEEKIRSLVKEQIDLKIGSVSSDMQIDTEQESTSPSVEELEKRAIQELLK